MMKLLLSLALLALTTITFGQSISLSKDGNPIEPNSTLYVIGDPTDAVIQVHVDVTNTTGSDLLIKAKKVIHEGDTLANTSNYFCWGACFPPFVYESGDVLVGAGQTNNEFTGDYEPHTVPGKSMISYVWWVSDNPSDSVAISVEYNASPASIAEQQSVISRAYPNPATDHVTFDYSISGNASDSYIVISNILGARVMEIPITDNDGSVKMNVSELTEGVYFYSLVSEGVKVETQKIIIR
jgi:hypothetical protein